MDCLNATDIEILLNLIREKIECGGQFGELIVLRDLYKNLSLNEQLLETLINKNQFSDQLKEIDEYLKIV